VKIVPPGGGEVIGDSRERRVEILCDRDEMHVTWSRFAAGRDGADLHVHDEHTDVFFVLAGELTVRLGPEGEERTVPAGGLARVPPGIVHGFRNGSAAEMRYLNVHAPGSGFADYMRGLRDGNRAVYDQHDPPADGGRPKDGAAIGAPPGTAGPVEIELAAVSRGGEVVTLEAHDGLLGAYVLEGELTVTTEQGAHAAPAGTWIEVPPGTPHALTGAGRFLLLRA
jgi:quercetin dioxygenase-like cupin family protein